jgi:hypothetical protein
MVVFCDNGIKVSEVWLAEELQVFKEITRTVQVESIRHLNAENSIRQAQLSSIHYLRISSIDGFDSKPGLESISTHFPVHNTQIYNAGVSTNISVRSRHIMPLHFQRNIYFQCA